MILPPGTFRVSDYRKAIPASVEREVRRRYELDHDPALTNRPYDTDAGDFIPPQHDPGKLFLREKPEHDEKTFGRKAGAAKTVTTRGSDVGERTRTQDIRKTEAEHTKRMAAKGEPNLEAALNYLLPKPRSRIQSRGFDKRVTKGFDGKVKPRKERRRR